MNDTILELKSLFEDAKKTSEFEFIMTLINYRSMGAKEEASNLHEWFEAIEFYKKLFYELNGNEKTRIGLLLYSTFFENSDFYNILGSLCKNKMGYRGSAYLYWKTKKYERLLGTGEKINLVSELFGDCNKHHIIDFFVQNHYQEIRNTFFHSAYSLSEGVYILHDSESIIVEGESRRSFPIDKFLYPKIENILLFFNAFKELYIDSFSSYTKDKKTWGIFPVPREVIIHGSNEGLKGFTVKNTAQFYGEWVDSGIYYMPEYQMWAAKNIQMDFTNVEDIEIDERIKRYEAKDDIKINDSEFFNLVEKISDRNRGIEIIRVLRLLIKFGDKKYDKWKSEENFWKKKNLPKTVLPYYKKAIGLNKLFDLTKIEERIIELEKE
jgi:hypothetical protein